MSRASDIRHGAVHQHGRLVGSPVAIPETFPVPLVLRRCFMWIESKYLREFGACQDIDRDTYIDRRPCPDTFTVSASTVTNAMA
jgi:hypothetical protein